MDIFLILLSTIFQVKKKIVVDNSDITSLNGTVNFSHFEGKEMLSCGLRVDKKKH